MKTDLLLGKTKFSAKTKKIISTVCITLSVCGIFIWFAKGIDIYASEKMRENLTYIYVMYSIFPIFSIIFGALRIKNILKESNGEEEIKEDIIENEQ